MKSNLNDIFLIKKDPPRFFQNTSLLSTLNKFPCSFQDPPFADNDLSVKDAQTEKHFTSSSFVFFPLNEPDDIFNLDCLSLHNRPISHKKAFNRQASMRSFFRQASLNSRPPNNNCIEEEMYIKLGNSAQKQEEDMEHTMQLDIVKHNKEVNGFKTLIRKRSLKRKNSRRMYKCEHVNCGLSFKTLKQKMNHHKKMCKECKKDTINMLKMINMCKMIMKEIKGRFPQEVERMYSDTMRSRSLEGYAQIFVGLDINDVV